MKKSLSALLCFTLALFLGFSLVSPSFVSAQSSETSPTVPALEETFAEDEVLNQEIDKFLDESGISEVDFESMTEEEIDTYFENEVSEEDLFTLESEVNKLVNEQDYVEGQFTIQALPVALAPIAIIALRIAIKQGTKPAVAYLKKATKKLTGSYKISFPGGGTLILLQDKKSGKRLFAVDNASVKLVHKTTGKGYNGSFKAFHFHKAPDMSQHYLLCSTIPKNYKVQKGKCYF
ncbi:hypothetical protein ACIQLG_00725 [Terribacillus saccharophilus]|uniref:hypothetical protein n=1 Tax=Terribacillus saccharophilus TaxID=361277 RepID=UPI0037FA6E3D